MGVYLPEADMYSFFVKVDCWQLDWQLFSVSQIFNALSQTFSAVEVLALQHKFHNRSFEEHNNVDRVAWRKLLTLFSNVKTLGVEEGLVEQVSSCLVLEDGELPLELLPEMQKLIYSGRGDTSDEFTSFIDARRNAGRPVTLISLIPKPKSEPELSQPLPSKAPVITSAGGEAET